MFSVIEYWGIQSIYGLLHNEFNVILSNILHNYYNNGFLYVG
jgi:hypothetical protein